MDESTKEEFRNAIEAGDIVKVKSLISNGVDLNESIRNPIEDTPIAYAAFEEKIDIVKLLIEDNPELMEELEKAIKDKLNSE